MNASSSMDEGDVAFDTGLCSLHLEIPRAWTLVNQVKFKCKFVSHLYILVTVVFQELCQERHKLSTTSIWGTNNKLKDSIKVQLGEPMGSFGSFTESR